MSKEQARIHSGIKGNSAILNWMRAFGYLDQTPVLTPMKTKTSKAPNTDLLELRNQLKHTQKLLRREDLTHELAVAGSGHLWVHDDTKLKHTTVKHI